MYRALTHNAFVQVDGGCSSLASIGVNGPDLVFDELHRWVCHITEHESAFYKSSRIDSQEPMQKVQLQLYAGYRGMWRLGCVFEGAARMAEQVPRHGHGLFIYARA